LGMVFPVPATEAFFGVSSERTSGSIIEVSAASMLGVSAGPVLEVAKERNLGIMVEAASEPNLEVTPQLVLPEHKTVVCSAATVEVELAARPVDELVRGSVQVVSSSLIQETTPELRAPREAPAELFIVQTSAVEVAGEMIVVNSEPASDMPSESTLDIAIKPILEVAAKPVLEEAEANSESVQKTKLEQQVSTEALSRPFLMEMKAEDAILVSSVEPQESSRSIESGRKLLNQLSLRAVMSMRQILDLLILLWSKLLLWWRKNQMKSQNGDHWWGQLLNQQLLRHIKRTRIRN